jgi:F-type H+-transporting ATPase subunit b
MKRLIGIVFAIAFIGWPLLYWKSDARSDEAAPESINWADHWFGGEGPKPFAAMAINFAILAAVYYTAGKKPIGEALKARRASIAKEIEEANRMRQEAEARAKQYQSKLETLEEELVTAKAALLEAARGERDRVMKEAEEKAARMQKDAEFLIEQEIKQMRQDLWRETVESAVATAEELLKKRITSADQERLAEDYLEDLAGRTRRPTSMAPTPPSAKGGA